MTLVKIVLERPTSTGWEPARGSVIISASKRHDAPSSVHLPDTFRVRLGQPYIVNDVIVKAAEAGVAWAEMEPSTMQWVWKFDERVDGGSIRYKRLDQASGEIEYIELVEVDPKSFGVSLPAQWEVEAGLLQAQVESNTDALAQITAGSGPAYDTFLEIKAFVEMLDSATGAEIGDLVTAIEAKADPSDITDAIGGLAEVASSGAYGDLSGRPTLGTAAAQNVSAFATAAQGETADVTAAALSGLLAEIDGGTP